jgi:hypothetical protein
MMEVRLIKMLGLAVATALTALAFVGAGTASADSACLVDPGPLGMCPGGAIWNGPIIGLSEEALFKVDGTITKCKSNFLADYVFNEGPHVGVLYLILNLNFNECVGACPNAFAENLPYLLLVRMAQQHAFLNGDGKGPPAFLLQNCFILNMPMNCLYRTTPPALIKYLLELNPLGGFPLAGALDFNLPLKWAGDDPLCPQEANFEATYLIYEDQGFIEGPELFFTALP